MWARCNFCSSPCSLQQFRHWVRGVPVPDRRHKSPYHAPPPHVMLHQPRFWSCWVLGRRTEEGVPQHLLDRSAEKGRNKGIRIIYFHSSHSPPFSYSSFLYFLHNNLFFFTIRRLSEFQLFVINKGQLRRSRLLTASQLIFQTSDVRNTIKTFPRTGGAPTNERKVKAVCAICHVQLPEDTRLCCTCIGTNTMPTN